MGYTRSAVSSHKHISSHKHKRADLQKIILYSVAAVGIMGVALLAPNVVGTLADLGMPERKRQREFINTSRTRLIRRGLLAYTHGKLSLTPKGERQLQRLRLLDYRLQKPKKWDKKWRVLIFDIPEKRKPTREKIRNTLVALGFLRLQDSVWAYPHDCEDIVTLLKADFRVGKDMLYMTVEHLEYDAPLRARFGL